MVAQGQTFWSLMSVHGYLCCVSSFCQDRNSAGAIFFGNFQPKIHFHLDVKMIQNHLVLELERCHGLEAIRRPECQDRRPNHEDNVA